MLIKASTSDSISIETTIRQSHEFEAENRKSHTFGVLTYLLSQVLTSLGAGHECSWRRVMHLVKEAMHTSEISRQALLLEGNRDLVPFSTKSVPFVISLSAAPSTLGLDPMTMTMDGGLLHGVAIDSLWIAKNREDTLPLHVKHTPCGRYLICQYFDTRKLGLISLAQGPQIPNVPVICKDIPALYLPSFCIEDFVKQKFRSAGLAEDSPTAYRLVLEKSKADVIITASQDRLSLTIPSLGHAEISATAPVDLYSRFCQIGHFLRNLRM